MANPVLTATLSGQRKILLSWTYGSNADFQVFWKSSSPPGQEYVLLATTNAFSYTTADLDPSQTYNFYVRANVGLTYENSNTVELFVSCGKGVVITPDVLIDQFLNLPYGAAIDDINMYISDTYNARVVRVRISGYWPTATLIGIPQGGFTIFISGDFLYLIYPTSPFVMKINKSTMTTVSTYGENGTGDNQLDCPYGFCCDGTYIYIADQGNNRILKWLLSDYSYVSKIGSPGSGNNQFNLPFAIATDNTYLYVADTFNCRIVKRLCSDLSYVSEYGTQGWDGHPGGYTVNSLNNPWGVGTDGTYLFVADTQNNRIIKRLCSDLSYVSHYGVLSADNDGLAGPNQITCYGGNIYIGDAQNYRIMIRSMSDLSYVGKYGNSPWG